jgi:ubiquinone/menaquinone biosynthesis C-methylase UbiE
LSDLNYSLLLPQADRLPQTIAERTRRVYDVVAGVYPISTFFFHSRAHAVALRHSGIQDGMCVLEVATGSGEMFEHLVRTNPTGTTFGLDLSPNMAAFAQKRARKVKPWASAHCSAVDVRHLPFQTGSFDAVMCCYLIELLSQEDISRALREIRRVLRPGGRLSLIVIGQNVGFFNRMYRLAGSLVPAFWGRQVEASAPTMLREAGFEVVVDEFVRQGFYPSRVLIAENAAPQVLARATSA